MKNRITNTLFLLIINICIYALITLGVVLYSSSAKAQTVVEGMRTYRVTAIKAGATSNKAIISQSNTVKVAPPTSLFVPNAFTPNGDGLNDKFGIAGQNLKEVDIQVYNRWGELVFETKNPKEQWDGTYRGEIVSNSVYVYKISARGFDGEEVYKSGNVTLLQ